MMLCLKSIFKEKEMATHSSILPGEFHEQRSWAGYSPWDCRVGHDWVISFSFLKGVTDRIHFQKKCLSFQWLDQHFQKKVAFFSLVTSGCVCVCVCVYLYKQIYTQRHKCKWSHICSKMWEISFLKPYQQ